MKTFENISELPENKEFGVIIGNFDGVHRGHQKLLSEVKKQCADINREMVVVTFQPHPLVILRNQERFLLNSYEEKRELFSLNGVKWLVEIPFTRDLSMTSPSDFLDNYILCHKGIKNLFLGHDFAFGANKKGDHNFVIEHCKGKEVEVDVQEKYTCEKDVYSSSNIRKFLLEGSPELAADMLGRNFFLKGRVIKGVGRGKQIGFPTANIDVDKKRLIPEYGVYATICSFRGCHYKSITNIGKNPTFDDVNGIHIETNIFDFEGDIYGEEIQVSFLRKLRGEKKFSSVNELIEQIKLDVEQRKAQDA